MAQTKNRTVLMQGNEACVEGAMYAGLRFFGGYPITPSSEIAEILAERLPQVGGRFIQMEDEIASMGAVIGASLTGAKSMTATSGPGFSLKQENIGFASLTQTPCVIVNVQRMGPSTGLPTSPAQGDVMQAKWGTHGDHPIVCVVPQSVGECFTLTVEAFNISEELRVPVIVLTDEVIGHMREKITLPEPGDLPVFNRKKPAPGLKKYNPFSSEDGDIPPMAGYGDGYHFHVTGLFYDETGFPTGKPAECDKLVRRLMGKIERRIDRLTMVEEVMLDDAEIVVFAYGCSARSALRAVREARAAGIKAGMIRPKIMWPFPERVVRAVADRARTFIVPEMSYGQIIFEVERCVAGKATVRGVNRVDGEIITPNEILTAIKEG